MHCSISQNHHIHHDVVIHTSESSCAKSSSNASSRSNLSPFFSSFFTLGCSDCRYLSYLHSRYVASCQGLTAQECRTRMKKHNDLDSLQAYAELAADSFVHLVHSALPAPWNTEYERRTFSEAPLSELILPKCLTSRLTAQVLIHQLGFMS